MRRPWQISLLVPVVILLAGGSLALSGCGKVRHRLECRELALRICEKWFECYAEASETYWGDVSICEDTVFDVCNDPAEYGCEVDTDDLIECNDNVSDSPCLRLPASCRHMIDDCVL